MVWANVGWNEGDPRFHTLPNDSQLLARNSRIVPTSAGLNNADCSLMPVNIFLKDHRAATIQSVINATHAWQAEQPDMAALPLQLHLAAGNVGIMAATNEVIAAEEKPILVWVYAAIILMCWLSFRNFAGVASVILPLSLVSLMAYGLMAVLGIGLKVATLPVAALAVGIGVDYGIYIYDSLHQHLKRGEDFETAYFHTLQSTGKAVIFTGLTLGLSVCTWLLSKLQFQADMGILLVFMFVANMFGAIFLLPAIARVIYALGNKKTA
jgi:predicted RND superfamily exporter protein